MALTPFQRDVCRLLASARRAHGESYLAGGAALGAALHTSPLSRALDVFHDTAQAVNRSWDLDRTILASAGYRVETLRERPGYVEALATLEGQQVIIEWTRDSAFRFFPLLDDDTLGLVLHPFDLATNKVLALIGRAEARDWIDVIDCHERLQPLGYLAWAACGKDPGFTPAGILEQAKRSSRYTDAELSSLAFDAPVPLAADLSRRWQAALADAELTIGHLPAQFVGHGVLAASGQLFTASASAFDQALAHGAVTFHPGRIGGAWPTVKL